MSGATLFAGPEIKAGRFGEHSHEVWDDVRGIQKIKSTIHDSKTREVKNLLLSSSSEGVHTAWSLVRCFMDQVVVPAMGEVFKLRRSQGRSLKTVAAPDSMLD